MSRSLSCPRSRVFPNCTPLFENYPIALIRRRLVSKQVPYPSLRAQRSNPGGLQLRLRPNEIREGGRAAISVCRIAIPFRKCPPTPTPPPQKGEGVTRIKFNDSGAYISPTISSIDVSAILLSSTILPRAIAASRSQETK